MEEVRITSSEEMEAWGMAWSTRLKGGDIVKITGPLGAGKTTLVRGIVAGLGGDSSDVHSPTFSLVHEYETKSKIVNHCDFYRLPSNSLLDEFGGEEFFAEDRIYLIEWPERIGLWQYITPSRLLHLDLQHDASSRLIRSSSR